MSLGTVTRLIVSAAIVATLSGSARGATESSIPAAAQPAPTFEISAPGNYTLQSNRLCAGNGILVNADDVTIDLGGFTLTGPDTGATYGILMDGRRNIEIRNGTVRNFGAQGIHDRNKSGTALAKRIIDMRVLSNGKCGICLGGEGNLIQDCLVSNNKGSGICATGIIKNNILLENETGGIACSDRALVTGNSVAGGKAAGIFARESCTIRDNIVSGTANTGIYAESGSLVTENIVTGSNLSGGAGYAGIKVVGNCIVRANSTRSNRANNILALFSGSVLEDNLVTAASDTLGNGIGFYLKDNHYSDNCASGNRVDFSGELPTGSGNGGGNISLPRWVPPPAEPAAGGK